MCFCLTILRGRVWKTSSVETGQGFSVGNAFIVLTEVTRHLPKQTGSVFVILSFLDTGKVLHLSHIIISF